MKRDEKREARQAEIINKQWKSIILDRETTNEKRRELDIGTERGENEPKPFSSFVLLHLSKIDFS